MHFSVEISVVIAIHWYVTETGPLKVLCVPLFSRMTHTAPQLKNNPPIDRNMSVSYIVTQNNAHTAVTWLSVIQTLHSDQRTKQQQQQKPASRSGKWKIPGLEGRRMEVRPAQTIRRLPITQNGIPKPPNWNTQIHMHRQVQLQDTHPQTRMHTHTHASACASAQHTYTHKNTVTVCVCVCVCVRVCSALKKKI